MLEGNRRRGNFTCEAQQFPQQYVTVLNSRSHWPPDVAGIQMRYDLNQLHKLCEEAGMPSSVEGQCLEVDLGQGAVLCFQNAEQEDDCLIGFAGMPWHAHDDLMFSDSRGYYTEIRYLDLIKNLEEGRVLICEQHVAEHIADRWLIHSEFNDEFRCLELGERIVVRRATTHPAK